MSDRAALATALAGALGEPVAALTPIAGGDLNDAFAATLGSGERVFVKTSADAAPGAFAGEATGLRWLAAARALPLPQPLAVLDTAVPALDAAAPALDAAVPALDAAAPAPIRLLALQWIDSGRPTPDTDELLGRGLARLHAAGAQSFGGPQAQLRIGPLTLPNQPAPDWPSFYAERRLIPLADLAQQRGALPAGAITALDRVVERLRSSDGEGGGPGLAGPPEPPARLHGDLWGGNVMTGAGGEPWLIDPAAHGGHREVDLAMLRLFGGPSQRAFDAYEEVAPLAPGAAERVGLWQLAPLLLHAALFGGGWGARAAELLKRYT
ncbi:fructosamine kinase family protein [Conexibacter stalactiti]|uniref:Fructosamine kinase family protein n=1 Tax=Conexibacter stalactiti TaxID=1940611 RepID=A0ABU4HYX8_9ACTN|nr:fructosamine kinase family protein [Conexibacter stalactiti]MDW5598527.1 fructosamine kinase family protein [Conexibacter stalactiti]MEC5039169.1 fructosamine kinase family protein [Conexibacter stalactiti]